MATQLQLRRGNTAQTAVFTGAIAEVTVDTDQKTVVVHDGVTVGGTYIITRSQLNSNVSILQGVNNTQNTNISVANGLAQGAYNTANGANGLASGAYNTANGANGLASGAYNTANGANGLAQGAYNQANTASTTAQGANGLAQGAYNQANTASTTASEINNYAQSAYATANGANGLAQAAFNQANTATTPNKLINQTKELNLFANGIIRLPEHSALYNNTSTLSSNTANQVLDFFSSTLYRTAKYIIQGVSGADVRSTEVLLTHNDTNVYISEYVTIGSNTNLYAVYGSLSSNVVSLTVSPANSNTTFDFVRTSLIARTLGSGDVGLQGDLMLQTGTEDLNTGSGSEDLNV